RGARGVNSSDAEGGRLRRQIHAGRIAGNRALDLRNLATRSGLSDLPGRGCRAGWLIWSANSLSTADAHAATRVRISSVCPTFFEISNCDARLILAVRTASRREGSDQNRIASRKPTRFAGLSTTDPCTPSSTISLNPLERVVIIGNPLASASRQALEKGS